MQKKQPEIEQEGSKPMSFKLQSSLYKRMENYLTSPVSMVRTKTDLLNQAIEEFLDREEQICRELELAREVIRKRISARRS